MEKSNHVSYPVPSVRKYDFVAANLAPAPRNPRDIASYCRGRGPDRSGLGLTADAATTQSKTARVRLVFRERVLDPGFDQIGNVSPVLLWMAWPHRQAPAPEPAQLRDDLLGFSSLP